MSSSNNSQPPPNSPFQGVADMPNGRVGFDGTTYGSTTEYAFADIPKPHHTAQGIHRMGMPAAVAGATSHLVNQPVMSSAQIVNSMFHTNDALARERQVGGGIAGYNIFNVSQQPFDAAGYDPTSPSELYSAMPAAAVSAARGNIANVGQMVQQAALYSTPQFLTGIQQDLIEGFNYNLLTQPSVSPNNPRAVAQSYNQTVMQGQQYQQLQMGQMTADKLQSARRGNENFLQTAVRLAASEVSYGVGNLSSSIGNSYKFLDPEVQAFGKEGIGQIHQAEIAGGLLKHAAATELRNEGKGIAADLVSYNMGVDDILADPSFTAAIPRGRETFVTHRALRDQPIPLTPHEMENIREVAGAYKGRAKTNAEDSAMDSFINPGGSGGFETFTMGGDGFSDDMKPNGSKMGGADFKAFIAALREATQAVKGFSGGIGGGAGGYGGGGGGGYGGGGGAAGGGGGGEGRISTDAALRRLSGAGETNIGSRTGFGYTTLGRLGGFISGLGGGQGTEDDTTPRRIFKALGRFTRASAGALLSGAAGAGGASLEQHLGSFVGFNRGFEGLGTLRGFGDMAAAGELPTMQASALLGYGTGYADMRQGMGGVGNMAAGSKYGISAEAMGQLFFPLASAAGGGPLDIQKTLGGFAAGEDVGGYYSLMGQQRQAGITSGHAMEFNAAKARGLKGSAATGFASSLYGAFASIDASMNMGQDRGTLEGQLLASGRGNIQRGAGVFQRGAGVFRGAKDFLLSPFQGVSDILLANEALAATGSYTGAVDRLEAGEAQGGRGARGRLNRMVGSEMGGLLMRQKGLSGRDLLDIDRKATTLGADDEPAFDQAGDTSGGATKVSSKLAGRRNEQIDQLFQRFATFEKILEGDRKVEQFLLQRLDNTISSMDNLIKAVQTMTKYIDAAIIPTRNGLANTMAGNSWAATKATALTAYLLLASQLGLR